MSDERLMKLVENHIQSTDQNDKLYIEELNNRVEHMDNRFKPKAVNVLRTLMSRQERGW